VPHADEYTYNDICLGYDDVRIGDRVNVIEQQGLDFDNIEDYSEGPWSASQGATIADYISEAQVEYLCVRYKLRRTVSWKPISAALTRAQKGIQTRGLDWSSWRNAFV
jgi:hypothetical protein